MFRKLTTEIKHKMLSISLLAALGGFVAPVSAAVTHVVEGGLLAGALNVDVNGTKYDVSFKGGFYSNIYPNGITIFTDAGASNAAANALIDQVFLDIGEGAFDSEPSLTRGCKSSIVCSVLTPYGINEDGLLLLSQITFNGLDVSIDRTFDGTYPRYFSTEWVTNYTYSVWSLSQSSTAVVPEPSTYAMISLGLFGLMGIARRGNNQD